MQLVINIGSTSKKYAVYSGEKCVVTYRFEQTQEGFFLTTQQSQEHNREQISGESYAKALEKVLYFLRNQSFEGVAIRVVAPGSFFTQHRRVDEEYVWKLEERLSFAPLHIPGVLEEIRLIEQNLPRTALVAVSDSAFHTTTQASERMYSLPTKDTEDLDLYRFGYHGLSVASIVRKLAGSKQMYKNLIIAHVGGGASVTAVQDGKSVANSMGFTPMSGLYMSSRIGDIDPDALLYLMEEKDMNHKETREYLYTQCGLLGLSGNANMKTILDEYESNDVYAEAVAAYVVQIQKYIGAYTALLGGFDALVLTGTIQERNPFFRSLVVSDMEYFGLILDTETNISVVDECALITKKDSKIPGIVVPTDEMGEMNTVLLAFLN